MSKFFSILVAIVVVASNVQADNVAAQQNLDQAKASYAERTAFAKDEVAIEDAIKALEAALAKNPTGAVRYEVLNFSARVLVWKGVHTSSADKESIYELAMTKAEEARKTAGFEDKAEAPYYYAVALGRWALEKGPLTVLGRTGELKGALDDAMNAETVEGDLGETVDFYGPARVYGRLYMELPALAGGSNKKARQNLEAAYTGAPEHSLNVVYYAQALEAVGEKAEACEVIKELLTKDPLTLIPDRAQEAVEDFADAKKFQTEKCSK